MYKTYISLTAQEWDQLNKYGSHNTTINAMVSLVLKYGLIEEVQDHKCKRECTDIKRTIVINNADYEDLLEVHGHRNNKYSLQRLVNLVFDEGLLDDAMIEIKEGDDSPEFLELLDTAIECLDAVFKYMPATMTQQALETMRQLQEYKDKIDGNKYSNKV